MSRVELTNQAAAAEAASMATQRLRVSPPVALRLKLARGKRISRQELLSFTSQLAIMTQSGVDVASALQSLARQSRTAALRLLVQQLHLDVTAGKSFSEALAKQASQLGPTMVASVAAGEAAGRLPDVLTQLARLQRRELRLRGTLRTLLTYPVLLITVSSLVLLALVLFVLPQFAAIFEQFETPLPVLTSMLLAVSGHLRRRCWLWLGLAGFMLVGGIFGVSSRPVRRTVDRLLLQMRFLRDVTQPLLIGRACRLMSIMIDSGIPVLESLRLTRASMASSLYQELFSKMEGEVMNGQGLGRTLLSASFVPAAAAEMIATAERTGTLATVTQLLGEHCEEEAEIRLRELISVMEPAIILAMGVLVAVVVLSVMLPMFDLATLAQQGH